MDRKERFWKDYKFFPSFESKSGKEKKGFGKTSLPFVYWKTFCLSWTEKEGRPSALSGLFNMTILPSKS